ncbi:uncharacterized protein LOC133055062 [Dama dama]|uniref:uncharacterized protein LOC133055062 n=1 Tax=Dama dama TaxID=30532 RepID=UPI002A35E3C3|nr:uncharacterized protein LOC133055062 [Dama dama]
MNAEDNSHLWRTPLLEANGGVYMRCEDNESPNREPMFPRGRETSFGSFLCSHRRFPPRTRADLLEEAVRIGPVGIINRAFPALFSRTSGVRGVSFSNVLVLRSPTFLTRRLFRTFQRSTLKRREPPLRLGRPWEGGVRESPQNPSRSLTLLAPLRTGNSRRARRWPSWTQCCPLRQNGVLKSEEKHSWTTFSHANWQVKTRGSPFSLRDLADQLKKEEKKTRLYNQLLLHGLCGIMLGLAIVSAQDNVFISWCISCSR